MAAASREPFGRQFVGQERIGSFTNVTTDHVASIFSPREFSRPAFGWAFACTKIQARELGPQMRPPPMQA